METMTDFIFFSSKIVADADWSHEIKRRLLLERKAMTDIDSILKSRDITLLTKVHLVKAMVFPVVMYGYESWTIKKAGWQRTDAFELWCWRRLLRDPWTARKSNQSILKEISPEYSLEGLMLKLNLQYFGHLMGKTDSLEKILMLGKIEGRRRGQQRICSWMASLTRWTWVWASSRSWWWTGKPGMLQSMGSQRIRQDWVTELKGDNPFETEVLWRGKIGRSFIFNVEILTKHVINIRSLCFVLELMKLKVFILKICMCFYLAVVPLLFTTNYTWKFNRVLYILYRFLEDSYCPIVWFPFCS